LFVVPIEVRFLLLIAVRAEGVESNDRASNLSLIVVVSVEPSVEPQ
jgi:hypothetical protein